jgi:hypothetical protein
VYGYLNLKEMYDGEKGGFSNTFVNTITSTIYSALVGGGVSSSLKEVTFDST